MEQPMTKAPRGAGADAVFLTVVGALALASCHRPVSEVVVYTSVDQVFSEPVFRAFEQQSGVRVRAVFDTEETKSTGVLNRLIAERAQPQADVFWSGDVVRTFLLSRRGLVEAYRSPAAAGIPAAYRSDDGTWTGFAARARVLLVNKNRVAAKDTPRSILDLADPRWRGQAALANPLFGTTTMHVAALSAALGEPAVRELLGRIKANGVRIVSSNGEVKRLVAAGEVAFGVADTDDAHEALEEHAPVGVVFPDQEGMGTLVIPTATVLLRGAPHPAEGRRLVDYLVSAEVERRMAGLAAHIPLRPGIAGPDGVPGAGELRAMSVDYDRVAMEMEELQPWLREWVGL
jgi:iron(III) transport system substrate-binding protein